MLAGTAAIQVAKQIGAKVFTTAGSQEKLDLARQLGADRLINYKEEKFVEVVQKETPGPEIKVCFASPAGEGACYRQGGACRARGGLQRQGGGCRARGDLQRQSGGCRARGACRARGDLQRKGVLQGVGLAAGQGEVCRGGRGLQEKRGGLYRARGVCKT